MTTKESRPYKVTQRMIEADILKAKVARRIRRYLRWLEKGIIPFLPSQKLISFKYECSRQNIQLIIPQVLTKGELSNVQSRSERMIDPIIAAKCLKAIKQEIADFWSGRIDAISTLEEIGAKYSLSSSKTQSLQKYLPAGIIEERHSIMPAQRWNAQTKLREAVLYTKKLIANFETKEGKYLPPAYKIADTLSFNRHSTHKWLSAHLTEDEKVKWTANLRPHGMYLGEDNWLAQYMQQHTYK